MGKRKDIPDMLSGIAPKKKWPTYKGHKILKCGVPSNWTRKNKYVYSIAGHRIQKKPFAQPHLFTLKQARAFIDAILDLQNKEIEIEKMIEENENSRKK